MRLRYPITLAAAMLVTAAPLTQAATGFSVVLNGANERPTPVATPATGSGFCVLNDAQNNLSYSISYSNLLAPRTAAHFHGPADANTNAGVVFGIAGAGPQSDTIIGDWAIDATNVARLMAEQLYVNIHSQQFPGGEIRGQVLFDATPSRAATWGRIKKLYR
jgi:hypothetical protein